jgi:hypothetical protein
LRCAALQEDDAPVEAAGVERHGQMLGTR